MKIFLLVALSACYLGCSKSNNSDGSQDKANEGVESLADLLNQLVQDENADGFPTSIRGYSVNTAPQSSGNDQTSSISATALANADNSSALFTFSIPENAIARFSMPVSVSLNSLTSASMATLCKDLTYSDAIPTVDSLISLGKGLACGTAMFSSCIKLERSGDEAFIAVPLREVVLPCKEESFAKLALHLLSNTSNIANVTIDAGPFVRSQYLTQSADCSDGGEWLAIQKTLSFPLSEGTKAIYASFMDFLGHKSPCYSLALDNKQQGETSGSTSSGITGNTSAGTGGSTGGVVVGDSVPDVWAAPIIVPHSLGTVSGEKALAAVDDSGHAIYLRQQSSLLLPYYYDKTSVTAGSSLGSVSTSVVAAAENKMEILRSAGGITSRTTVTGGSYVTTLAPATGDDSLLSLNFFANDTKLLALSKKDSNSTLSAHIFNGTSWTSTIIIAGNVAVPSLPGNDDYQTFFALASHRNSDKLLILYFKQDNYSLVARYFDGTTWQAEEKTVQTAKADEPWSVAASMNATGDAFSLWCGKLEPDVNVSRFHSGSFEAQQTLALSNDIIRTSIAINASGKAFIAWRLDAGNKVETLAFNGSSWSAPQTLQSDMSSATNLRTYYLGTRKIASWVDGFGVQLKHSDDNQAWSAVDTISFDPNSATRFSYSLSDSLKYIVILRDD